MDNVEKMNYVERLKRSRPFKPFAIVADDGTRAVIDDPLGCLPTKKEIVLKHPTTGRIWHLPIDQATVVEDQSAPR